MLAGADMVLRIVSFEGHAVEYDQGSPVAYQCWAAISLHYFSPYRPTLRVLTYLGTDDCGVTHLQATHRWECLFPFVSQFVVLREPTLWHFQFYALNNSGRPLVELSPAFVEVKRFGKSCTYEQRKFDKKGKRVHIARNVGEVALDALSDCSTSDHEDDAGMKTPPVVDGGGDGHCCGGDAGPPDEPLLVDPEFDDVEEMFDGLDVRIHEDGCVDDGAEPQESG